MAKFIKDKLGNFFITCLIFSIVLGWFFSGWPRIWQEPSVPPKIQQVQASTENLYVDSYDAVISLWTKVGTPPYLSTQNQPTDYIYSASNNQDDGNYGFADSSGSGTINSVTLYIYAYGVASTNFTTILSGTDTGLGPPTSWGWVNVDVSTILTTWAEIDAATVLFDRPVTKNDAGVDAAYLLVDYSADSTLTQNDSRWYWNQDSVQPGGAMANENTTSTNATSSAIYRIRMNITIGVVDLPISSQAFKLQYGTSTTGCPAVASWSDVGGLGSGVIWRGYDNAGTDDGITITSNLLGSSNVKESYEEANPSVANLLAITNGQDGEWDWVVQNNSAPGSTTYCFRMIKFNNDLLDAYNADGYPAIVTAAPSLSCNFSTTTASFGTLTTGSVTTAYGSTTIDVTSGDTVFVKLHDTGGGGGASLYYSGGSDNIGSADSAYADTATLEAGTEGYGMQATTTGAGSGAVITILNRYDNASTTNNIGALELVGAEVTMASSTAAVTNRRIIMYYKAAINASHEIGGYLDTLTYTCSTSQ